MRTGVLDISEATGFSAATVSNALNHKRGVNPETAARILAAARQMGYFDQKPITSVRLLHLSRGSFDIWETPFFVELLRGVERECRAQGLDCVISVLDPGEEGELRALVSDPARGVILLATDAAEEDMTGLRDTPSPLVLLDNCPRDPDRSALLIDNRGGARQAADHLLRRGHTDIGYLACSVRFRNFREREAGLREALAAAGHPLRESHRLVLSPEPEALRAVLVPFLEAGDLPTAFFADNDHLALTALRLLRERGLRVPEDISLVGFDDIPYAGLADPPLTTLRVDVRDMGRTAVRLLLDRGASATPAVTRLCTRLVERDSVKDLKGEPV